MQKRFFNKTVVVTGGSKWIGRATAIRFAKEWANLIITTSRDADETEKTLTMIRSHGVRASSYPCDVADETSIKKFFWYIREELWVTIDILVHAAGISPNTPLDAQTPAEWENVLKINLTGTFLVAREAKENMTSYCQSHTGHSQGSIVLMSASNGINSFNPLSAHYDASKAWVVVLTRNFAKEYAKHKIRVNSVAPWWIATSLNDDISEEMRQSETQKIYLGRWGTPEEVASTILFLSWDDASFITGTTLLVDGGYG